MGGLAVGVGVGWVSILDHVKVKALLGIPDEVTLVAYLCVGFPKEFRDQPLLEEVGWAKRLPVGDLVFGDTWGKPFPL